MDELNNAFNDDVPVLTSVEISVDVNTVTAGITVLTVDKYTELKKLL